MPSSALDRVARGIPEDVRRGLVVLPVKGFVRTISKTGRRRLEIMTVRPTDVFVIFPGKRIGSAQGPHVAIAG
jgi:hypothetical protein